MVTEAYATTVRQPRYAGPPTSSMRSHRYLVTKATRRKPPTKVARLPTCTMTQARPLTRPLPIPANASPAVMTNMVANMPRSSVR